MFHSKVWIMLIIKLIIWNLATFLPMSQHQFDHCYSEHRFHLGVCLKCMQALQPCGAAEPGSRG